VTLEVPLCIAEVTGDYERGGIGEILYPYPYGSDIGMAVYGGPQGEGTTFLDLAYAEEFNWSYEGLVIALEVRATGVEMPILIGLDGAPGEEDWIDYAACGDDEDSLTLTVTDITRRAPENDLIENATALELGDSIDIDLTDATSSYSDPTHPDGEDSWPTAERSVRSAWYTWTAPATKTYAFDTNGTDCVFLSEAAYFYESCGDTVLAVFEGNPEDGFSAIASNDDCGYDDDLSTRIYEYYLSCLELDATEGTEYYFMVASYGHFNEYINIHVQFDESTAPINKVAPRLLNSNVLRAGRTVSVDHGDWRGGGAITYDYAWYVCKRRVSQRASAAVMQRICTEITGADTASFTPTRAQARQWRNRYVLAQVTATNDLGHADALTGTSHATMR